MANEKYALLDTDFISKMHLIRKDDQNKLIDKIMAMPNYIFYCHKQIGIEMARHNIAGAPEWFCARVTDNSIRLYDDEMIMDELSGIYGELAVVAYVRMLQTACDAIGEGQNLGELKSYVLLQVLNIKFGEQIYVFCSDDKNARSGIVSIGGARCISVVSSFIRLQKEIGFTREDADPYIQSYMNGCLGKYQKTFKVQDTSKEKKMCKVPCEQVFDEMFIGKIEEMKNGNLKYI